jgi:hypothetical protein
MERDSTWIREKRARAGAFHTDLPFVADEGNLHATTILRQAKRLGAMG